ncbi:tubulin alpha chain [Reticulomyxa filosa]|uniref:Tubulin alpha chain n=1 Tax=Reticulomyxa filosa TaxID=46433 RepID=X6PBR2_RETFI|nr:tubulin alpha chain [Reticulomyxa filosa]|eukprot:ETO35494.1 tubulin alpha chain [Reticulomyxa filosa]
MLNLELLLTVQAFVSFFLLLFVNLKEMREVLTIEVGQACIQLGKAICEQYCAEQGIDNTGKRKENSGKKDSFKVVFEETVSGEFVPYDIAVDLEPNVTDDVKNGPFAAISHTELLVHGKEDAANNFARGHYTISKLIIDKVNDQLRKLVDNCDNLMGFFIGHSVGGGTDSGLGALTLDRLAVDYRKKPKIDFDIYTSPNLSTCVVELYNALLSTHWLLDHAEVSLLLDNEAIHGICQKKIENCQTRRTKLEQIDFEDLNEFQTNLATFPRLHFMTAGMSTIIPKVDLSTAKRCQKITDTVVLSQRTGL